MNSLLTYLRTDLGNEQRTAVKIKIEIKILYLLDAPTFPLKQVLPISTLISSSVYACPSLFIVL